MVPSFHNSDKPTHRRVMVVGLLFCFAFVVISFSLRPQAESGQALVKADRLVRTAAQGKLKPAAWRSTVRQVIAWRSVIGRDGDEAGIADHIDQNFHPRGHDTPFPAVNSARAVLVPAQSDDQTRAIAWLAIACGYRPSAS